MSNLTAGAVIRGRWRVRGYAPVVVSDPVRLYQLAPRELKPALKRFPEVVPYSIARHIHRIAEREARKELGRILSGASLFRDDYLNLVVNEGLDDLLDVTLSAATQDTSWFVGLTDGTPTVAAGDTLSSHGGWAEVTGYDEAARQAWTDGGVSSQSVDNSGSPATFTITSDATTVGGAFLAGDNTKGGTTGQLYAAGAFSGGDQVLGAAATLDVTATFSTSDDGS